MEIKVKDRCWDCFGLEATCSICNDTGTIEKWISLTTLISEIEKNTVSEWQGEQEIILSEYPTINDTSFNIPPNINI